ncbi:MAG: retron St85 family effector protein [Terracidiphilus sp.]
MDKALVEVAKSHNLAKSFVQNRIPKLFLCGGETSQNGEPPNTLRGFLVQYLENSKPGLRSSTILAEEAATWYLSTKYFDNLVDLEEQIAALSTLILLIVESPGSMTELGAFSFVESLRNKLYVVLEESYQDDHSFIVLGPIEKIKREGESDRSRYYTYEWFNESNSPNIDADRARKASQQIVEEILEPAFSQISKTEQFDSENVGHRMLLVADLVSIGGALLVSEIMELLTGFNVTVNNQIIARDKVEQYLFILDNLKLLKKQHAGNCDYYVQIGEDLKFINYSARERLRIDINNVLQKLSGYKNRTRAREHAQKKVR